MTRSNVSLLQVALLLVALLAALVLSDHEPDEPQDEQVTPGCKLRLLENVTNVSTAKVIGGGGSRRIIRRKLVKNNGKKNLSRASLFSSFGSDEPTTNTLDIMNATEVAVTLNKTDNERFENSIESDYESFEEVCDDNEGPSLYIITAVACCVVLLLVVIVCSLKTMVLQRRQMRNCHNVESRGGGLVES